MNTKLNIEFIKSEFEKEGYTLLTKIYNNNRQKLEYICSKGHRHNISWSSWNKGSRCAVCSNNKKLTIEFIRGGFEKEGYILLTKTYINAHQKLEYICLNNHKHSITRGDWSSGKRCPYCANNIKLNIEFIHAKFVKEGYILLTKVYENAFQKLEYICPKGHKHFIIWNSWQQGRRCPSCAIKKLSLCYCGSGNPSWKGGISCEPYCQEWTKELRESIKKRDSYKCLNPYCNSKHPNRLAIHHINYNKKDCREENLITTCRSCNPAANTDREWHEAWYKAIMYRRYGYIYDNTN